MNEMTFFLVLNLFLFGFLIFVSILYYRAKKNLWKTKSAFDNQISRAQQENHYAQTHLEGLKKEKEGLDQQVKDFTDRIFSLSQEKKDLQVRLEILQKEEEKAKSKAENVTKILQETQQKYTSSHAENEYLSEKLTTMKEEIKGLQEKFTATFENLAAKIMDEKSTKFMQLNQDQLKQILTPFREQLSNFKVNLENSEEKNRVSQATLVEQIKNLQQSNKLIREDAVNLTKALKGDVKLQGNWGEIILERVLETSGLQQGREYVLQAEEMKLKNEDGNVRKPDVIIHLPQNKHLVIDSKVSLVAYEKYCNEETNKESYLIQFLQSVKNHINNLHSKHYQNIKGLQSPDFVFLFLPIESTFSLITKVDSTIFDTALQKQIVIVSPTTLLATLRTISYIWKQENQTKFAYEIARRSGKLYDSFVLLIDELEKFGYHLDKSKDLYFQLIKRISSGRGNLISRIEQIKQLGARADKQIPATYLEEATEINQDE